MLHLAAAAALLGLGIMPTPAHAADGQSSSAQRRSWQEDLRLGLSAWSYGPALGRLTTGRAATPTGDLGSPVTVGTQLTLSAPSGFGDFRYLAAEELTWNPFDPTEGAALLTNSNPTFGVTGTHHDGDRINWSGQYDLSPAITDATRATGQELILRAVENLAYTLDAGKRWRFGATIIPSWTLTRDGSSQSLYASPSITYTVNDRLNWGVFMETAYSHGIGAGVLDWSRAMEPNLGFGPTYSFRSGYWMQPFVNLYPGARINADTTQLGVFFGGRVL